MRMRTAREREACTLAAMFGSVMNTSPMSQLYEYLLFHNSILCNNIQSTYSALREKQRKRKRKAVFSLSATLDGCVCQAGQPCSLMMAMPAHKPSLADMCVCVCVIFQDG